ncbi:MAG: hypothetical protein EHM87_24705, partial [Burkholderiales bacterium]
MKFLSLLFLSFVVSFAAHAQMTIVVAFPPGGDTDVLARLFAAKITEKTGKPVVVENKVGASGAIGSMYVSSASPDGSVILLAPSTLVTAPL